MKKEKPGKIKNQKVINKELSIVASGDMLNFAAKFTSPQCSSKI